MAEHALRRTIEDLWERRESLSSRDGDEHAMVSVVLDALDSGLLRVAERGAEGWHVNQWLKKAVLLSFRL
ncbi:MAG: 2,3,4,5-tetrahydropyridine-2,6-dicarboxylate N-succinyltransferase, partial [Acetobacteraceae bacterium]